MQVRSVKKSKPGSLARGAALVIFVSCVRDAPHL